MLTPQDKAQAIIDRMYFALPNNGSFTGINNVESRWEEARRCAEIAVQEMVDEITSMQKVFPDPELFETYVWFWQETLTEIKTFKSAQEDKIDLAKLRTTQFSLEMATNAIQEAKQETIEEVAKEFAKNYSIYPTAQDDTEYGFKHGAEWMLEKLQDFDTWKEWKDMYHKEETIVTEYRDGNIKVETFKSE